MTFVSLPECQLLAHRLATELMGLINNTPWLSSQTGGPSNYHTHFNLLQEWMLQYLLDDNGEVELRKGALEMEVNDTINDVIHYTKKRTEIKTKDALWEGDTTFAQRVYPEALVSGAQFRMENMANMLETVSLKQKINVVIMDSSQSADAVLPKRSVP